MPISRTSGDARYRSGSVDMRAVSTGVVIGLLTGLAMAAAGVLLFDQSLTLAVIVSAALGFAV